MFCFATKAVFYVEKVPSSDLFAPFPSDVASSLLINHTRPRPRVHGLDALPPSQMKLESLTLHLVHRMIFYMSQVMLLASSVRISIGRSR